MKKFKFTLQKVLEYNTHMQKREKDILTQMKYELNSLYEKKDQLENKYTIYKNRQIDECFQGIALTNLILSSNYLNELQKLILLTEEDIYKTMKKIEKQIQILLSVTKEKTTLEKLKDKHILKYNSEERKQNELFIDEFAAVRSKT